MCLRKDYRVLFIALFVSLQLAAQTSIQSVDKVIDFNAALRKAIDSDPRVGLNASVADAAEGQIEQADLPPNPVIGGEVENFLGTGPITGVQGLEVTLGISQVFETADKQTRRTALARREREIVDWQRELLLTQIEAEVRAGFIEALLTQDMVSLREDQLKLAEEMESETRRLVDAAHVPLLDLTRATLAVRQKQFERDKALRELQVAKSNLASQWGTPDETDFALSGNIALETELPDFAALASRLPSTAQIAQYEAVLRSREAALDLEKARAVPDFEIFAGGRYYNEDNGNFGFVAGFEVPWPVFNQNQGNIRTARAQVRAAEQERESVRRQMMIDLNRVYQELQSAYAEAQSVQAALLPGTEETVTATEEGYERGQYSLLDVIQSREMLYDVQETYLDALQRYAAAQAEIESLTRPSNLTASAE